MRSLCVGTVYQTRVGDPASNSIQLHRDGVLRWRRDRAALLHRWQDRLNPLPLLRYFIDHPVTISGLSALGINVAK